MFIKELEITGFKSFANKVKLSFDRQISAIVGPNGCGKSNVLDAMKWVLGEKSIKSMRGEKSEDVIFSGTETIKPSGYASVLFTLDNSQRMLDVDSDEVKIGRNLYRDGQSQYFLNSAKVTRKEIEHALMDTGLGKSSYSFMEQGKMDMILSSRPEERRILFEEAAGISKFKSQKEEALRNLENTQINITRLKDVQKELYRELKIKEDQAKKTKVYNDLMNQKKENELKIYFLSLSENEENLEKYNEALQKKMEEKEKISQKLLLYEESIKQLDKEKEERKKEFHQKDTANRINREKINQWEQAIQNEEKRKKDLLNNLEIQKEQIKKNKIRFENLKKEFDSQNQLTLQLDTKLENAQKALASMAENIKKIEKEITENELKLKSYNDELKENKKTLEDLRLEYEKVVKDLLKSLKEEKDKWLFHEKERLNIKNNVVSEIFHIIETLAGIQELLNKRISTRL
ncbi:MAG: AAA family ATPase [Spirochaetia bacterium]|nr:AAA family ATPase [Spirochaetia bacterium]